MARCRGSKGEPLAVRSVIVTVLQQDLMLHGCLIASCGSRVMACTAEAQPGTHVHVGYREPFHGSCN